MICSSGCVILKEADRLWGRIGVKSSTPPPWWILFLSHWYFNINVLSALSGWHIVCLTCLLHIQPVSFQFNKNLLEYVWQHSVIFCSKFLVWCPKKGLCKWSKLDMHMIYISSTYSYVYEYVYKSRYFLMKHAIVIW